MIERFNVQRNKYNSSERKQVIYTEKESDMVSLGIMVSESKV